MQKLLDLSRDIDEKELFPLVQDFTKVAQDCGNLSSVYDKLTTVKQKTKNLDNLVFISALLEAVAIFNDFSAVDAVIKKEMLQGCRDSTQFYLNRILKESKEKNEPKKQQWAKELEDFLNTCQGGTGGATNSISKSDTSAPKQQTQQQQQPNVSKSKSCVIKDPKIELVGQIWYVENHFGNNSIEINADQMQQRVVIINCNESVIQIKGKCTAISVENGSRVGVVVHDVIVSTFEILNSSKTQIQLNSTCPTVTVDNCEGIQIFLGVGVSENFELLTSKSNEVNLYRQKAQGEDYSDEIPVPEQFKTYFDEAGNLKTEAVRHTGA